jgi:hypothetical protein
MSNAAAPGSAGVADDVLVEAPRRGCRGCLRDGHTGNHTIPKGEPGAGQLRRGHTHNAVGRPNGRPNNTTLAATDLLKEYARPAAEAMVAALRDENPWVRVGAAKTILERTLPKDPNEPRDESWVEYATDDELAALTRIIESCRRRMPVHDMLPDDEPADATPPHRDSLAPATLPAPAPPPQEAQPDDDPEESFPTS